MLAQAPLRALQAPRRLSNIHLSQHNSNLWPLDSVAYSDILKSITNSQILIHGKSVHAHLLKVPFKPCIYLQNNLLNMYCKCGAMASARRLFDEMALRDIVSWNSIISGYTQVGFYAKALRVFIDARNAEARLDKYSYACALSVCARTGDLNSGRLIHGLVVVGGFSKGVFLTNSLIDMYSKCQRIEEARRVFESSDERDDVSWNSLISAHDRIGLAGDTLDIFARMHRAGERMNCFALGSVLKSCSSLVGLEGIGKMVHCCVVKLGLEGDVFVGSAMLDLYAKSHALDDALKVFRLVPNPNVVVFNAMIAGFGRTEIDGENKLAGGALDLFREMQRRGMRPSKFTFSSVLRACNLSKAFEFGKQIHGLVFKSDLKADEFIMSSLIDLYSNAGSVEDGLRCFISVPKQDIVTWTSMISGYVENEQFERALGLFHELLTHGRVPDLFTITSAMSACANLAVVRTGAQIQNYALKSGFVRHTIYGNSQIFMYSRSGDIDSAGRTFQEMECPDVVSYSAMISSHAHHGCAKDAFLLFKNMEDCGITPNHVTFLAILTACSHSGMVDEGLFRYFESMKRDYHMKPNAKHCSCVVDLLGRVGRLDDAEDFILESGFGDDPIMWRALLGSCRIHKDMNRALRAAEHLMELDPNASASYVLMYNMYFDAGKLSLANKIRDLMKERGVKKEPGLSWIEIGKLVHSFVVGDKSHPKSREIYAKLVQMLLKIEEMGYTTAETVTSDELDLEPKQTLLNCHSEKLAVALGMIDLPESAPIRVIKNLRVCTDCHTTMKLFSKSEAREIILRDPIRFHRFRDGSCSCADFW